MPLTHFKLADGSLVSIEDALEKGVLIDQYPTAYLRLVASQRPWQGKVSTTQAIAGTRKSFLMITTDYAESPDEQAFRTHGSITHAKLEQFAGADEIVEQKFSGYDITGIVDYIEEVDGKFYLTDYKTSGAYKIKKAKGFVKKTRPAVDDQGYPILYKKSGKGFKAGDQKTDTYSVIDLAARDCKDWDDQLNFYRIIAEQALEIEIESMRIFAIVRDGGIRASLDSGVDRKTYMIEIPKIADEVVLEQFGGKRDALVSHMTGYDISIASGSTVDSSAIDNIPPACTPAECWDGRMCEKYCPVADACRKAGGNRYMAEKPEGKGGDSEFKDF